MEKAGKKCRDINFRSKKNNCVLCVHNRMAREYARWLEDDSKIERYEVGVLLERQRYSYVNPIEIRKAYFDTLWTTDFVIYYQDGTTAIREIATREMLSKRAGVEKLEFSRRYWESISVDSWKVIMMEKGE